jgi:hypothetical protein
MIHYSYDFIINLANNFSATLDEDVANRLLEIKKGNKFIRRKSPMRMKYKIHDSVAQNWRKDREEKGIMSLEEKFNLEMHSNLNKLTSKNYSTIVEKILALCDELLTNENRNEYEEKLIQMVFDKANTEKTFSYLYAQLLSNIAEHSLNDIANLCLRSCDTYYKNTVETNIEEVTTDMSDEELRKIFSSKNQLSCGYIFMANLFVFNLLSYDSILKYYNGILKYFEICPLEYCDTYLDIIENLLKTAGYQLEQKAQTKEDFYNDFMSELYKLQGLKSDENPKMSNKNRFKVMDITDLYKRNWNVRQVMDDETDNSFKKNKDKKKR